MNKYYAYYFLNDSSKKEKVERIKEELIDNGELNDFIIECFNQIMDQDIIIRRYETIMFNRPNDPIELSAIPYRLSTLNENSPQSIIKNAKDAIGKAIDILDEPIKKVELERPVKPVFEKKKLSIEGEDTEQKENTGKGHKESWVFS